MKLTDFRYEFEKIKIPTHPVEPRDAAKLMVINRAQKTITHETFADIHKYKKAIVLCTTILKFFRPD